MSYTTYRVQYQVVTVETYEAEVTVRQEEDVPVHVLAGDVRNEYCLNTHVSEPRNVEIIALSADQPQPEKEFEHD